MHYTCIIVDEFLLLFQVGPHEIYVVGRDDDGGSLDDGASDAASWETVDDNEMDVPDDSANVFSTASLPYFFSPVIPLRSTFSFLLFLY
jgi:hypothetical protein